MTTLPLNGVRLRVRLIEVELSRLNLDPENPRLHSGATSGRSARIGVRSRQGPQRSITTDGLTDP